MKRLPITILMISATFSFVACTQSPRLVDGEYTVMGVRFNPSFKDKAMAKKINASMPNIPIEGNKFKVSNDFPCPYFVDSEYDYKLSKDSTKLKLKGKNSKLEMKIEIGPSNTLSKQQSYTLFIDNEYLQNIHIIEEKR